MNIEWQDENNPMQNRLRLVDRDSDRIVGRVYDDPGGFMAFDMNGAPLGDFTKIESAKQAVERNWGRFADRDAAV